jgi:two-component system sensor histidine kinase KdpD
MRRVAIRTVSRSLLAVLMIVLTSGLLHAFRELVTTPTVALLYLLPVGLSTALWGLGPGLVAALGAFLAFNYFFLPPYFTLHVLRAEDILVLLVFLVVAVTISQLVGRAKSSLARAQAREHEAIHLHELTAALVGLRNGKSIVRAVAEQVLATFRGDFVRVSVRPENDADLEVLALPSDAGLPMQKPTSLVPIQGMRGQMGEITLWRGEGGVTSEEEQLLRTFGREAALAVERVGLALAEDRAHALAQSDALKSAILSSVSHELRTPLATIKAAVTSLRSAAVSWDTDARDELLEAVEEETDHLNDLVGNLLDMSRIEAGSLKPQRQWNDLGEILRSVLGGMKKALAQHSVVAEIPSDLALVPVDFVEIEQVFRNLLSNSAKYSPPETTIRVSARQEGSWVLVEVQNEGPSIPEDYLERIFDKFFRVTAREQITGTGLGLSICKGIVEAHGGRIWAENLPGGMAFKFLLPMTWEGSGPRELDSHEPASSHPGD